MARDPSAVSFPAAAEGDGQSAGPIIVDMGKGSRKDVRKLRKGKPGKLMRRVEDTIEHLREQGAIAPGAQPVIIVVRQREKSRGLLGLA